LKNTNTSTLEDEIHEELTSDYIMEEWMGITSGTTNYSGTTFPIAYEGTPDGGSPVFIFSLAKVTINGRSTSVLLEKKLGLPYELFSIGKKYSIIVKLNSDGKIDNLDDVTMGHGYKGTEKVTKISDDGKGFTFTTATGSEYIVSNLDATGVAGYQTTKVASTEITTTTTNDKDTTELFSPNKTHSIKVKLDNAGKIVSAALAQDYKETDKFKKISADGKSFTFTNAAGVEYTITPVLANSTYNTVKN
jgi:hypothetical protein